jgi:putative holliday junction resolvase
VGLLPFARIDSRAAKIDSRAAKIDRFTDARLLPSISLRYKSIMRILGLDLGERRVGVAVSDPDGRMASPLLQFEPKNREAILTTVARLVDEQAAGRVVVGMPFLPDGSVGQQARRAEGVVTALRQRLTVPVATWDERYSTAEADRAMLDAGLTSDSRKRRRDKVAATLILQAYLDAGAPL